MRDEELLRYSRHILLKEIDLSGQEKLAAASILIIGAGGLGCPAAMYLAASGVGKLLVADDDIVDLSNLQRQIAHGTHDVGMPKVVSLVKKLEEINPEIVVTGLHKRLDVNSLGELIEGVDVVLDCSDNFSTRMQVNSVAALHKRTLVSGAAIQFEGQLSVFNRTQKSPCYACLYAVDANEEAITCVSNGVFSPLVGIVGSMMAAEAIKVLLGIGDVLDGRLLVCDVRNMEWRSLALRKDPLCPVCSERG